jgi:FAD/FMN-containing dehydrogenase
VKEGETVPDPLVRALRESVSGQVADRDDPAWESARASWNLALDQRPAAVVFAESADDVAAAVRVAADRGVRVAPQGSGHGASARGSLEGALLLRVDRMGGVLVAEDAGHMTVRAGSAWADVAAAVEGRGVVGLAGSAPDVHVAGYTLGGGCGWFARAHGLACNAVTGIDVVTADGRLLRADAESEPDLFWALRGGGGSFGVVTGLEMRLFPAPEIYGASLFWPIERAGEMLGAWREWAGSVPETVSHNARLLRLPPLPDIPEPFRGRAFAQMGAVVLGGEAEGREALAAMRALGPEIDTGSVLPVGALGAINMDPPEPVPFAGDGGVVREISQELIDAVLGVAGPGAETPLLGVELRATDGAVGRPAEGAGALPCIDGDLTWFAFGVTPFPGAAEAVGGALAGLRSALAPLAAERGFLNFSERPVPVEEIFGAETAARLSAVRAAYDPDGLMLPNHEVPVA